MLFRVCEHYNDDEVLCNKYIEIDECFVCYEITTNLESQPTSLRLQTKYYKKCNCNGWIHKNCLDIWYNKEKKCPICRNIMTEKNIIGYTYLNITPYTTRIYIFISRFLYNTARVMVYFFVFYATIEFYLTMLSSKMLVKDRFNIYPYTQCIGCIGFDLNEAPIFDFEMDQNNFLNTTNL